MNEKNNRFGWLDLIKTLWHFLAGQRKVFFTWNLVIVFTSTSSFIYAYIFGQIINTLIEENILDFYFLAVLFTVLFSVISVVRLTAKQKAGHIRAHLAYNVRIMAIKRILDMQMAWHDEISTGEKTQKIETAAISLQQFVWKLYQNLFNMLSKIIGAVIAFLILDFRIFLFLALYLLTFYLIQKYYYSKTINIIKKLNVIKELASGKLIESVSNVRTIKSLGINKDVIDNVEEIQKLRKDIEIQFTDIKNMKWKVFQIFNGFAFGIFMLITGQLYLFGVMSIGFIYTFYAYFKDLINASGQLTVQYDDLIEIKSNVGRLMEIYNIQHPKKSLVDRFPKDWTDISLSNVSFSYGHASSIFSVENVNLNIKRGERVAFVGESGSGKSTLLKLLIGLYEVNSGSYKIGRVDVEEINKEDLLNNIVIAPQNTELFKYSFQKNIALDLDDKFNEERYNKAIKVAQLEKVVDQLSNKDGTLLDEGGHNFSGGQRQRIGIARALYKNPQILLLDESTSQLDMETEQNFYKDLKKFYPEITVIAVAHRTKAVSLLVDRVYKFSKGKIMEVTGDRK